MCHPPELSLGWRAARTTESIPSTTVSQHLKDANTVAANSPTLKSRDSRSIGGDIGLAIVLDVALVAVVELLPERRLTCK